MLNLASLMHEDGKTNNFSPRLGKITDQHTDLWTIKRMTAKNVDEEKLNIKFVVLQCGIVHMYWCCGGGVIGA